MPIVVHEIIQVGPLRGRTLPERVIEIGGNGHLLSSSDRGARVNIPGPRIEHAPDDAGTKLFHGLDDCGPTSSLVAHLDHAFVLAGCLDEQLAFAWIVAARLLDIDMLAGGASHDRSRGVPMIWSGD